MKIKSIRWKIISVVTVFCLCAVAGLQAQQRTGGGGGGFGGFGGFGGGGFRSGSSSSSSSGTQYNGNGTVGDAIIQVDPDTGNIVVIADEQTANYIGQVLTNLDRPKPQVLIKVVFLQLTHTDGSDIGVEGGYQKTFGFLNGGPLTNLVGQSFGLSSIGSALNSNSNGVNVLNPFGQPIQSFGSIAPFATPGAGMYQLLGNDFQATLRAIAAAGKAQVLSRPSILARDRQQATVVVGQSVPLVTGTTFTSLGNTINSVTYTDVGIILKVTPFISPDGLVEMIVDPQTSSVDPTETVQIATGVNAPVIDVTSADTVVTTPDGQTVVIGGLMESDKSENVTKIPLLGDIPLLGNLFKRTVKSTDKTELMIFLTPHIIRAPGDLVGLTARERKEELPPKSSKSYSEEELDKFLETVPVKPPDPVVLPKNKH
jgi:type II secretion system protein D